MCCLARYFVVLLLIFPVRLLAKEIKYPFTDIPDSLLKDAKAIVRDYSIDFEMNSLSNLVQTITMATTILDRTADNNAIGYYSYSKEIVITSIEARFYNKEGILYKKIGRSDFEDKSYDTYGTLYNDNRYLRYKPLTTEYPYTVEYKVTYKQNNSFSFPSWYPIPSSNLSIQYSSLKASFPKDYEIRVKEVNLPQSYVKSESEGKKNLFWEIKNLKTEEYEVFKPAHSEYLSYVLIEPSTFQYNEYGGTLSTWIGYGNFIKLLNYDRTELNDETIEKIKSLVSDCKNNLEKTKLIYQYLQNRTRYVNISIGIGSFQPFPASTVDKYGYGDCKALSNYMVSLLGYVGIKAYYSVVKAGPFMYHVDTSFVYNPFNHIIVYVPLENDTVWLECTSQIQPFGYLGDFTDNRYALVISDDGGTLVKTKEYTHDMNQVRRNAKVVLNLDGTASAKVKTSYEGLEYSDILNQIHSDYKTQKDYLYNEQIDIPDFKIDSFRYQDYPDINPICEEYLYLSLINYASVSGIRMFITLNLMDRSDYIPPKDDERKNPIMIYNSHIHTDSICYEIPDGYKIEYIPENSSVTSDFANVTYTFKVDSKKIFYTRKYEPYFKEHPKEKYNDLVAFYKNLKKADYQKVVLVKSE